MAKNWYRVEVSAGGETHCYFGTSERTESELVEALQSKSFLLLDDLTYFDEEGTARTWTEWDPHYLPRIYLNPHNVITVMCLVDDPRKVGGDNNLLTYPGGPKPDQ